MVYFNTLFKYIWYKISEEKSYKKNKREEKEVYKYDIIFLYYENWFCNSTNLSI